MNDGTRRVLLTLFLWFLIGGIGTVLLSPDAVLQLVVFAVSLILSAAIVYFSM